MSRLQPIARSEVTYADSPRVESLHDLLLKRALTEARVYVERCKEDDLIDEHNLDLVDAVEKLLTLETMVEKLSEVER